MKKLSFLFWNINKRSILDYVVKLVHENDVDILILAESELADKDIFVNLKTEDGTVFYNVTGYSQWIKIYSRLPSGSFQDISDPSRATLKHITPPTGQSVLLAAAHLPSKLNREDYDQEGFCRGFMRDIEEAENRVNHKRTIIIGDLNVNPFEKAAVAADCLNAVMDKGIARKNSRTVDGQEYSFFYNPMWSRLGDDSEGPAGTYFRDKDMYTRYYWHTFDQVLLRPDLLSCFSKNDLKVITEVQSKPLISETGKPEVSDHLPILIRLNL